MKKFPCKGPIDFIEFEDRSRTFDVYYKNGEHALIGGFRIIHFLKENRDHLSPEAISEIKMRFLSVFNQFETLNQTPLNSEDCLNLYVQIFELICRYKANNTTKPLLVLLGEQHESAHSLLIEMIVIDILNRYGLKNVCIEADQTWLDNIKATGTGYANNLIENIQETCQRINFLVFMMKPYGCEIVPIDNSELQDLQQQSISLISSLLGTLSDLEKSFNADNINLGELTAEFNETQENLKKARDIDQKIMDYRDIGMQNKLSELSSVDPNIKLSIVGQDHLKGICDRNNGQYALLPILCTGKRIFDTSRVRFNNPLGLFAENSPVIEKIRIDKDCEFYNNMELFNMVLEAKKIFLSVQTQLWCDESADLRVFLKQYQNVDETYSAYHDKLRGYLNYIESYVKLDDLKRYGLRYFLKDLLKELDEQNHPKTSEFYKSLSALYHQFEAAAYQINHLNAAEQRTIGY